MGIRVGNFDLQQNSLFAAAPLFASVAKSNYTTAIAHYLSTLAAYLQLEENYIVLVLLKFHMMIMILTMFVLGLTKH